MALGVDQFGIADGLPGMFIPDLAVTGDGRLWLSASGHLVSFDGEEFETHDLIEFSDTGRVLRGISAGRADTLWVLIGRRLFSHANENTRERFEFGSTDRSIWQGEDGALRAWDDEGVLRIDGDTLVRDLTLAPRAFPGAPVTGASPDTVHNLWIHHPEAGALRRVHGSWVLDPLPFPEAWPIPDSAYRTLLTRARGPTTEVMRLDGTRVTAIPAGVGNWPLLLDRRGLVWTQRPGRIHAVDASGRVVATLPLTPGARVTSVAEDREGNIWLGTVTDGLFRIRARRVLTLAGAEGVTDGQVLRLSAGDSGSVLAITHDQRVFRIRSDGVDTILSQAPDGVRPEAALVDRLGTLWLSIAGAGAAPSRVVGRTASGEEIHIPVSNAPVQLVEDPVQDGVIWGLGAGMIRMRPYEPAGPIVDGPFLERRWRGRDMLVDPEGVVWITGEAGLARISASDTDVQTWLVDEGFELAGGRSLYRSADGTIWIGHYQQGLVRFRDGEFRAVRAADGLWDDGASTILEDDAGNLWMSSNRGVHRVARSEVDAFLDGDVDRVHGHGYGQDAGFRNAETSGWHGHRTADGRLWFPTFSGVAVIDPRSVLASEQAVPRIRIRWVSAGAGSFGADSVITLPRGERRVDVSYGAILLSGQRGVRYDVMLEDIDPDWRDAGGQRQVTYGNLPPGRHVFRARAVSGPGVLSAVEATVTLIVPPFFHETAAFRLLMVLLACTALWLAYYARIRQLRTREITLSRLVDERTHELARSKEETEAALVTVEAQTRELRTLDEAKSRFFANVSHELRTPLTLVQGPLQDVLDGRLGPTPDPVRKQVATVLASGRRLGELVEQLLDVARLEAGEFRIRLRTHDLAPLFDRLANSFAALAKSKDIAFEASVPDGSIHLSADVDHIEKVFSNLLANALKFTPAGGRVTFRVDRDLDESYLHVIVEDTGPGIPAEEQTRIFERFHQVDGSSRRVHGGTGLGLALVKEITALHGGSVELWSEPGKGSRFTVHLPMTAPATSDVAVQSEASGSSYDGDSGDDRALASAHAELHDHPSLAHSSGDVPAEVERPAILVVEDHAELRGYLRRHLEERYHVIEAVNGLEGLEAARRTTPDLILCDIMMPGMDGEELCRAIRSDPELAFLPVIMVTARASRQSRLSALEGGADDYLVKPFDPEELRLRIANALESRRRFAERLRAEGKAVPFIPIDLPDARNGHDFASKIEAVLRERMGDEDFDVDDMAEAMAMSRATLYRKAGEILGVSPKELLWTFRLRQVAHWLRETDGTVSEIAYASGFKTVPHFTRRFKEHFGTTPAAYRRDEA